MDNIMKDGKWLISVEDVKLDKTSVFKEFGT